MNEVHSIPESVVQIYIMAVRIGCQIVSARDPVLQKTPCRVTSHDITVSHQERITRTKTMFDCDEMHYLQYHIVLMKKKN